MTCIVGLAHQGAVYIGGDSCAGDSSTPMYVPYPAPKVFRAGPLLLGVQGSFRAMDLLRWEVGPLLPPSLPGSIPPERWLVSHFVPVVRSAFEDGGFLRSKGGVQEHAGAFLAGVSGRLYLMQTDLAVVPCPDAGTAIGSGAQPARGSLHTTRQRIADPVERVHLALEAAEAVVTTVRGPHRVWRLADGQAQEL